MTNKHKNVPELRFKGFTDDWEQRKLGEVFEQTVEYIDPKVEDLELWSVTIENGLTPKTERYNREAITKKTDKYKAVHPGEIVYNPMNMTLGSVGFNKCSKTVAVSGYYVTMKLNQGFNNSYFNTWMTAPKTLTLYKNHATGSLIEKQRVQFPTLSNIISFLPSGDEQEVIGQFFLEIDNLITLHQRKLDLLKEQKKGYLQKMFPKNGEIVPELRFEGFAEAWEQRKFGDVWAKSSERNTNLEYSPDKVISVAQMKLNPSERDSTDEYMKTYNILHKGDIAFEGNKSKHFAFGRFVLNDIQDGIVSHVFNVYRPKVEMDIDFMKIYINNENVMRHILVRATTKTLMMTTLNTKDIVKQHLHIPMIQEQKKIGKLFSNLDHLITLHQRKLDLLKEQKKGFLQKMFV